MVPIICANLKHSVPTSLALASLPHPRPIVHLALLPEVARRRHCAPGPAARGGQEEMRSLVGCLPNKMPSDFGSSLMHVVAQHVLDTPCTVSPPQSPKVDSPMLKAWIRTAWGKEGGRNTETAHHESIIIG